MFRAGRTISSDCPTALRPRPETETIKSMALLAELSDHIYNFPLPIFYMQEQLGIFDEPGHSFEDARWSQMTTWPSEAACWRGWYQQYRLRGAEGTGDTVCLTVKQSHIVTPVTDEFFTLTIDQETTPLPTTLLDATTDPYEVPEEDDDARIWRVQADFNPDLDIRIHMQNVRGCGAGHVVYRLHAVRSDTGCEPVRLDPDESFLLPAGEPFSTWEFESDLATEEQVDLYCAIAETMQALNGDLPWADGGGDECPE
jgi:hypothetical protein